MQAWLHFIIYYEYNNTHKCLSVDCLMVNINFLFLFFLDCWIPVTNATGDVSASLHIHRRVTFLDHLINVSSIFTHHSTIIDTVILVVEITCLHVIYLLDKHHIYLLCSSYFQIIHKKLFFYLFVKREQLRQWFSDNTNHCPPPQCSSCRFIHNFYSELQLQQILLTQFCEKEIFIEHRDAAVPDGGALLLVQLPGCQTQFHGTVQGLSVSAVP